MAEYFLEPQNPLKKIDEKTGDVYYIYPETTAKQVKMDNGERLNTILNEGILYLGETDVATNVAPVDADTLGGHPPEYYLPEETGVEAGTYGGYTSPTYNIPNITIDEYGRVIDASTSVLTTATSKSNGLISYTDYQKLSYIPSNIYTSLTISAGSTSASYSMTYGTSNTAAINPIIYATGKYIDTTDGYVYIIPIKWKLKAYDNSSSSTVTVYIDEPIAYDITVHIFSNYQFGMGSM